LKRLLAGVQVLRIISKVTWRPVAVLEHPEKVTEESVVAFQEVRDGQTGASGVACPSDDDEEDDGGIQSGENRGTPLSRRRYMVCEKPVMVCL
jgi:hypothetical protein